MDIQSATSKAGVARTLDHYDLSKDDFVAGFPHLVQRVQGLPDEDPEADTDETPPNS
ncbi:hypothetical protein ACE1SV_37620 [Streptomyces sennicomposti]